MSVSRGNGQNGGHFYSNITKPIDISCNFTVDPANGNGLGIRSLKSNGYVENIFMHTSATPGVGSGGFLNPNPASGIISVQMKNNYNYYLGGFSGFVSPVSGTPLTATTNHTAYVIVSLGTATLAQWQAVGFPMGFVPVVGAAFVATASATIGGSAAVEVPSVSGTTSMEVIGDPNTMLNNSSIAANAGARFLIQILGATSSSTTTLIPTAPAVNSVIGLNFRFDGSSVTIDGL